MTLPIPPLITSLFKDANTVILNQYQNVNGRGETATIVPNRERAPESVVDANKFSRALVVNFLT